MEKLPPINHRDAGDTVRNILYPFGITAAVATVWAIGWAGSVVAKANVGYWSSIASPQERMQLSQSMPKVADPEKPSEYASADDGND